MQPADSAARKPGITHFAKAAIEPVFAAIAEHDRQVLTRHIAEHRRRPTAQYRAFRRSLPKPAIQQLSLIGAINEPRTHSDAPAPPDLRPNQKRDTTPQTGPDDPRPARPAAPPEPAPPVVTRRHRRPEMRLGQRLLADERARLSTTAAQEVHRHLIEEMCRRRAPLPGDLATLVEISGCSLRSWQRHKIRAELERVFEIDPQTGKWWHPECRRSLAALERYERLRAPACHATLAVSCGSQSVAPLKRETSSPSESLPDSSIPGSQAAASDAVPVAAREGVQKTREDPRARCARLSTAEASPATPQPASAAVRVEHSSEPRPGPKERGREPDPLAEVPTAELWAEVRRRHEKSPALKAQIRLQLQRKHIRFLHAHYPDELPAYWETQAAGGPAAQQQFDAVDRRMRRERWDDMRWWTDIKAARPRVFGAESIEQVMRRTQAKHSAAQRQYSGAGSLAEVPQISIAELSAHLAERARR